MLAGASVSAGRSPSLTSSLKAPAPAPSPKALAAWLNIAPQTGTALLRELQEKGVVREVTVALLITPVIAPPIRDRCETGGAG